MQGNSPDPHLVQLFNLILHQGNQGGYDQAHPIPGKGGNLEGNGLTATGGQESEGIIPGCHGFNDILLYRPEFRISPVAGQYLLINIQFQ